MYHVRFFHRAGLGLLLTVALLLGGCAEKWEPGALTTTRLIAGTEKKVWKFHAIEVIDEGEVEGPISVNELFLPCERDNEYVFYNNQDKRFEFTSGTVKCDSREDEVLLEDYWSYVTASATLEFVLPLALFGQLYILPFTVKKLTETEMVLEIYFNKIYLEETDASYRITLRSDTNS